MLKLSGRWRITVYQEQVMLLSRLLADFTRGQSDTLRKAMGKKMIDKMNELKALFIDGGQKNGHDPKVLDKIWADWEKFASYAFNKSHATCYSWVAFQTAYLKANYPAEYMAAVLSRNSSDITKLTGFMDECKKMRIPVKGPDVNESFNKFGVNKKGEIRFGLSAIKGVGENVVKDIIAARDAGGPFESIFDFVERVPLSALNRRTFDSLALAGAFDCFSEIKREDFFEKNNKDESFSEQVIRYGQLFQNASQQQEASLFGDEDSSSLNTAGRPEIKPALDWVDAVKLEKERELVGMYLSAHPLDPFYMELNYGCNSSIKAKDEVTPEEEKELTFGGMVTGFQIKPSRKGGNYGILKVEDYSGSAEFFLFGQQFIDFGRYGQPGTPILITGKFQKRFKSEELRFNITNIKLLQDVKGQLLSGITIKLNKEMINTNLMDILSEHIKSTTEDHRALSFMIYDPEINRSIKLASALTIPLNRNLVNILESMGIEFTVER